VINQTGNVSRKTELLEFSEPAHRRRATKEVKEILSQGMADFGDFSVIEHRLPKNIQNELCRQISNTFLEGELLAFARKY
jgi:hypothetical protein